MYIDKTASRKRLFSRRISLTHFIICELIFCPLFAVLLIYHGPFTNLRDNIISTAMGTQGNRLFATWFLSKEEINQILQKTNSTVKDAKQDVTEINIMSKPTSITANMAVDTAPNTSPTNPSSNKIQVIDITGSNYKGELMVIPDPSKVVLKLAPKIGEIGAPLSEFVSTNHAVAGINAGGFQDDNFLGTGATPDGIALEDGQLKYVQSGLDTFSVIGFNQDNVLIISNGMTLQQIKSSNLRCAVSFGPALILNGQPLVVKSGVTLQPHSAIGQKKDGTILLLAIDGRQSSSHGANYLDIQNLMLQYGAYNAANLDGGSSTTLNYQGKTINNPCNITGERFISSAFLVMP